MKHFKNVTVPEKVEARHYKTTCDMCEANLASGEMYKVDEAKVQYKTGDSFPEGGSGELVHIDICGKCFTNKLIPWIKSQGVEPTVEYWEW